MTRSFFLILLCFVCDRGLTQKINGFNLVLEHALPAADSFDLLKHSGANWACIRPVGLADEAVPLIEFDADWQSDLETSNGVGAIQEMARHTGVKLMLRPVLQSESSTEVFEFGFADPAQRQLWFVQYEAFILHYAQVADSLGLEMLCLGSELGSEIIANTVFWQELAAKVRKVYRGKLTYAATWENYSVVDFWSALDYIGVDAYFPCKTGIKIDHDTLMKCLTHDWKEPLLTYASTVGKPIIFTEFGYRSIRYAAGLQDTLPKVDYGFPFKVSHLSQAEAFRAFFKTFWSEPQVAGGFIWKWYPEEGMAARIDNDYTVQGKPTLEMIRSWYESFGE